MLTFVINLDRRPDRLAFMTAQLNEARLPFRRIAAIDGSLVDPGPRTAAISGPEHACALSHRAAWLALLESGAPCALVLEDDMVLAAGLPALLADPALVPKGADIVRLETRLMASLLSRGRTVGGRRLQILKSPHHGCGAYILTRAFAARLVREIGVFEQPVDHLLFMPGYDWAVGGMIYQLNPGACIQAELFEPAKASALALSDLEAARRARFALPHAPPPPKGRRTAAEKMVAEIGRWIAKSRSKAEIARDTLVSGRARYEVPFEGPLNAAAAAALSVPRGEQAVQSEVPALRLLASH